MSDWMEYVSNEIQMKYKRQMKHKYDCYNDKVGGRGNSIYNWINHIIVIILIFSRIKYKNIIYQLIFWYIIWDVTKMLSDVMRTEIKVKT